jgi:two-component sensor histidine kinase
MNEPFTDFEKARAVPQVIVDSIGELPLRFDSSQVRLIYALDDAHFNIPALRLLLEKIIPDHPVTTAFEVEREFPGIGRRTILLKARKCFYEGDSHATLLLDLEDITKRRACEREKDEREMRDLLRQKEDLAQQSEKLLRQKDVLLREMRHRIANSLQIIASILMLKARAVTSKETRLHLYDAHRRVMLVAAAQEHLHSSATDDLIPIGPYLSKLCDTLAASMIGGNRSVSIQVLADSGTAVSAQAVGLGFIVSELVINALKHAFPANRDDRRVVVSYETDGSDWKLVVSDNGIGKPKETAASAKSGLGTTLVKALAQQLDAQVDFISGPGGTIVSVTHTTFTSRSSKIV